MKAPTPWAAIVAGLTLAAQLGGCCFGKLQLTVTADAQSNGGRPVYVLAREIDAKAFEQEGYDAAVGKVAAPDDSVRWVGQLAPGERLRTCISKGKKGLGLYIFYATPQDQQWRVWLQTPPQQYELRVK